MFELERIERLLSEIDTLRYKKTVPIKEVFMKNGNFKSPSHADESQNPFEPFLMDQRWGGIGVHAWFRSSFTVPKEMDGTRILLRVETGKGKEDWDAANPQLLAFLDDEVVQGLDCNHQLILLDNHAQVGKSYRIDLQGYGGTFNNNGATTLAELKLSIVECDVETEQLYYDILAPWDVAETIKDDPLKRAKILQYLENAVNILDLRKPYSLEYSKSVKSARDYLKTEFYEKFCGETEYEVSCIGHTHIDVAWLWEIDQTKQKVQRSFATVLKLMEEYPEYKFMSSQPQLYEFIKTERPELYEKIKHRVAEGRWETEGAMWVEADCNLSSGESLVRQIIMGKKFFREEFGVESKILWLPDVFGYNSALPQILKKSNIQYFMTSKIGWNDTNRMPCSTFNWVGMDGSEVLTHFITTIDYSWYPDFIMTTYNGEMNGKYIRGTWEMYEDKTLNDDILFAFGHGDGGGGPTREMLELSKRLDKGIPGLGKTKVSTATEYFEALDKRVSESVKLPQWVGELYLEFHRGTLTSMARNKRFNRVSEFLYEEIEWLSVLANQIADTKYPKELIESGWKTICLNQFHDIIPGSSIEQVYIDSKEQYEEIISSGDEYRESAINTIVDMIDVKEPSIIAFNPAPFTRSEYIEIENWTSKWLYAKDIPAKGFKVIPLRDHSSNNAVLHIEKTKLENQFFKVELTDEGHIKSIFDKRCNREIIKDGQHANVMQAFEDIPHNFDAWDINLYYQQKKWTVDELVSIEAIDEKTVGILRVKWNYMDSVIEQDIIMYADVPRIDFRTVVDWKEKNTLLKVSFPVDIHSEKATYDIQFGNVERPTHRNTSWDKAKFEVCGHKWADLSEDDYGISLMNDCKYGYDIEGSNMRLTLIKSAISPNENADKEVHRFTYSIYPHIGDWKKGNTVKEAYMLNQPISYKAVNTQDGTLGSEFSLVNVDCDNVVVEVVKQAEDGNGIIVRMHECYNRRTQAMVNIGIEFNKAYDCDLEENILADLSFADNQISTELKPYEIKTIRLV